MRKSILVVGLMIILSASAYAGDMQFPVEPQPTPTIPTLITQEPTTEGDMQFPKAESVTQAALSLLESMLSLL